MRKLCDVDEVRKCLDEVTGDDSIYAKGLLEWAIKKRTIDEADIRADEREKVLDKVIDLIHESYEDAGTPEYFEAWKNRLEQMKGDQT